MSRVMIVGESPSKLGNGKPFTGPSGVRLATLLGIKHDRLPEVAKLVNLFPTSLPEEEGSISWSKLDAQSRARDIWRTNQQRVLHDQTGYETLVLCGARVWEAFQLPEVEWLSSFNINGIEMWKFPHPSSLSRWWNEVERIEAAGNLLKRLVFEGAESHQVRDTLNS